MANTLVRNAGLVKEWETHGELEVGADDLARHIELIRRQVRRSVMDKELRQLTLKVVANKPDDFVADPRSGQKIPVVIAYDQMFRLPESSICAMKDAHCESQSIWDFAVLNVRYVLDPAGGDFFATAEWTLKANGGDCDDSVILLAAMHKLVGFQSTVARVVSTDGKQWEHIYLLVGFPKMNPTKWLALDPTVKGAVPGWQYKKIRAQEDFPL